MSKHFDYIGRFVVNYRVGNNQVARYIIIYSRGHYLGVSVDDVVVQRLTAWGYGGKSVGVGHPRHSQHSQHSQQE